MPPDALARDIATVSGARESGERGLTGEWQPIESAPNGPIQFLTAYSDGSMCVYRGDILAFVLAKRPDLRHPTHWCSLPEPPVSP